MKTKALFLILLALPLLFLNRPVSAEKVIKNDFTTTQTEVSAKKLDNKAEILAKYLARFNSPLQYHAQDFIDASNTYGLDWKLLPSIAGVESTFGKQIPGGFNGWGWGVYGTQAIYFNSWNEAIFTIAKGLRENYLNKGLNDPYTINRVYAASPYWGSRVSYFMQDMEKFANQFEANQKENITMGSVPDIAAISGQLALR